MKSNYVFMTFTFAFMFLIGCSSFDNPAFNQDSSKSSYFDNFDVIATDISSKGDIKSGMGTLGIFNLRLNPSNLKGELTSLRSGALTDVLESVDITNFLELAPCIDCVKIKSIALDADNHFVVRIGIKHPFDVGDPLKPITGRNRADLHVFNVEGIMVSDSSGKNFPGIGETVSGLRLVNADGYTDYLDSSLDEIFPTGATIHPYVLHFDDYSIGNFDPLNPMGFASVVEPPPSGNLVMAMGCDYDFQDYVFDISESVNLLFAVGCTYGVSSASKNERFNPEYRIPQHNKKAASEIHLEVISNNLLGGDTSSTADIEAYVVDISHGIAVGDALNEMLADSSVKNILIEIPGVTNSPLILDGSGAVSGTGHSPSDPLVYEATITNALGAMGGVYPGLIKVIDNYASGQNSSPLLNGMDGIKRVDPIANPLTGLFPITEFATYHYFEIEILAHNDPPVANAVISSQIYNDPNAAITFDATGSYDPDGTVVSYEWDFNDDGLFDDVGDEYTGDAWNPTHNFPLGVCVDVQLKVTDNRGAPDELDSPLFVCPFKNLTIRDGVMISDVGTIMNTNEVLVLFDDHQVWKYSNDLSTGALFYTMPGSDTVGRRIAGSKNGDSICGWWTNSIHHTYSFYYNGTIAQDHDHSWLPNVRAPYNIDLMVSYMDTPGPNGGPGLHNMVGMWIDTYGLPAWIRAGYGMPVYYSWYSNYSQNPGPGPQKIDINFLKGVQALCSQATYGLFYLEGDPEWRVERSYILIGFSGGWGGTQTDANTGFYNPQDITSDQNDRIFVLDILSNGSRRIKKFDTSGTSLGAFGDNITMASDPERVDGAFASGWLYVTMGESISIFFPNEQP